MGTRSFAISIFVCLVGLCSPYPHQAQEKQPHVFSFPGNLRAVSLDRRFAIVSEDRSAEPYYHTLFLEDLKLKKRRKIIEYERSAEVLWNPDGKSIALTDHEGSNFALCRVFFVNDQIKTIPVLENLPKRVSVREQKEIQRNGHLYVQAVQWINPDVLRIKIWSHDSESRTGFERFCRFSISKSHP
jgi:hypothetical protein